MDLRNLKIPTPKDEVKYRPQAGRQLAYVDARYVQDKLDDIVGPSNWEFSWEVVTLPVENHPGAVHGKLKVFDGERWVTKEDVGEYEVGRMSAIKTGVSDALKRCAVNFGIGRDLYSEDYGKEAPAKTSTKSAPPKRDLGAKATAGQIKYLKILASKHGFDLDENISKADAATLIGKYAS